MKKKLSEIKLPLKVLTCQHCQNEFHGSRALQCHIDDQHTPQISCPICKKSFKKRMLLRHVRSKHAKDTNNKVNISSINISGLQNGDRKRM